jgi:hypothetical protein
VIGLWILHQLYGGSPQAFGLRQFARGARRLQLSMKIEHQNFYIDGYFQAESATLSK